MPVRLTLIVSALALVLSAHADWPHYRGPNYDGISTEKDLKTSNLQKVWDASVSTGFSGITVADGKLFTMGNSRNQDIVWCLNPDTGKEIWSFKYACQTDPNMYEGGPNATPTYHDGKVYTFSKEGHIFCLNAADGKVVWKTHADKLRASPIKWGFSGSPTVIGKLVIYNVGDSGAAFDRLTGDVVWSSTGGGAGYASPVPMTYKGTSAIAHFAGSSIIIQDAKTGKALWQSKWKTSYDVNAATPLVFDEKIFISSGYNRGCSLIDYSGSTPKQLWENKNLRNQFNSAVQIGDYIYGSDGQQARGSFVCLDIATGKPAWVERRVRFSSLAAAGDTLYVLEDRGTLRIIKASPDGFKELSNQGIFKGGRCWTAPTIANGKLYARNAVGDLVCYNLRK